VAHDPGARIGDEHALELLGGQVPSATQTIPAWIERPIPTPPPWWMLTQDAPAAVVTSALSSGQSAMASDSSAIPSVSR
jgi:hypothetical protein